jgi:hypothetical protein
MGKGKINRWQASGLHLLISAVIAAAVLTLMLALWFPAPLFTAAGGNGLLFILVGVDVVAGPLITLVIFKAGKRGLRFDLFMIALFQAAALTYGLHIIYLARPAFVVFVKDRFEVVSAVELAPDELAKAKYLQFRSPPLGGPVWAAGDFPTDPKERSALVEAAFAGLDLQDFPKYFVPYDERRKKILAKSWSIARVRKEEPGYAKLIDAWLAESGTPEASVRYLLLRARRAWVAVLVDAKTARPVKMLIVERI